MNILEVNDIELDKTNGSCTPELLIESTRQCIWDNAFTPEVNRWHLYAQACLVRQLCWIHYCIKSNPITASSLPLCPARCLMQMQKYTIPQCYCIWGRNLTICDIKNGGGRCKHDALNVHINPVQLRYLQQLLCCCFSVLFALGFATVCWGIAPVWPRVLMLFLFAAAAVLFVTSEGQPTRCDIRSST